MRPFLLALVMFSAFSAPAQYYYKDIVGSKESSDLIRTYMKNKVGRVMLTSYDAENVKSDDFLVMQQFLPSSRVLKTTTGTGQDNQNLSLLYTYANANGNVTETVDSSGIVVSSTTYEYDDNGNLKVVTTRSADTTSSESEQHIWSWENGNPVKMLRIKNGTDTTVVTFRLDENGNVTEETATRKGTSERPYFYYYNQNKQLTDVVRFSPRAKQLLPEYMFEYSPSNQVIQKITVPSNNSDYLIWRYQYDARGLKTKEVVYSKQDKRHPLGKIEYLYSFAQ